MKYQDIGLELHDLIGRMEPARWDDGDRVELAERFEQLRDRLKTLETTRDPTFAAARARIDEMRKELDALPSAHDVRERWMEFRTSIHPRYEAFADALKAGHVQLPSLRPTNYARSLVHATSGVIAVLFVELLPWWIVEMTIFSVTGLAWTLELTRRYSDRWNNVLMWLFSPIAHPHERYHVNSSTWYATALTLLALTGSQPACAVAVTALGFGDPAAALIGRRFGRTKLVNNRSLEGTLAFIGVAFATILFVLTVWHNELWPTGALAVAGAAAVMSALAELYSRRLDDNFTIPLVGGATAFGVLLLLGA